MVLMTELIGSKLGVTGNCTASATSLTSVTVAYHIQ